MIYFLLGFSLTLNIVSVILIIFGYKYIKNNLFVPRVEDKLEKELKNFNITKIMGGLK